MITKRHVGDNMRWLMLLLIVLLYSSNMASGQCVADCDSLRQAADSTWVYLQALSDSTLDTTHARPTSVFAPGFRYEYQSDSMHVYWYFSEFNLNKRKLFLSNWCAGRIVNYNKVTKVMAQEWTALEMNNRSTTRVFPISSGDTLGFYRELWMRRFGITMPVYDYYKCSEVLAYSVELVNSATNSRLALLDTTRYDTTRTSRKPCIASRYPMYSRVRYVVPEGFAGVPVFVRINTYVVGSNSDVMIRVDEHGQMRSTSFLQNPAVQQYCQQVEESLDCSIAESCAITATANTSPPSLAISITPNINVNTIAVYDVAGTMVWTGVVSQLSNPCTVPLTTSGLYLVVAKDASNIICTRKVVVP